MSQMRTQYDNVIQSYNFTFAIGHYIWCENAILATKWLNIDAVFSYNACVTEASALPEYFSKFQRPDLRPIN